MSNWWDADPDAPPAPTPSGTATGGRLQVVVPMQRPTDTPTQTPPAQAQGNWWDADRDASQPPSTGWDIAKSIAGELPNAVQGAMMAGPLMVDKFAQGVEWAANKLAPDHPFTKSLNEGRKQAEANRAAIRAATGPKFYEHTPETPEGEYAKSGTDFLVGSLLGSPQAVGRRVVASVPAWLTSETAGQVFKGTPYETPARIGGAVVGGGAGGAVAVPRTTERALSARLPSYVTQDHINSAENLINDAATRGITLTWPEALSQVTGKPVLTDMQRLLESSGETRAHMGEALAPRPEQFDVAAQKEFENLAPQPLMAPSTIGTQAQQAAKSTLTDARQIINAHTKQFYDKSRAVPIDPEDMKTIEATPGYKELRDQVRNDPHLNQHVADLPDNSVGFIDAVKQQYDIQAKSAASKFNPQQNQTKAASYTQGAQTMRDAAIKASPEYQVALNTQAQTRQQLLAPLLAGPLGKMAKTPETRRAIDALFPESPLPNSEGEVSTAVSALAKRNPLMASQLVRAHVEDQFNSATKMLVGGPNQFGAAGWAKAITANPQQYANLKAAVEALPDGAARWSTFENLLDIARATGQRQPIGSRTAFNAQDLAAMASGGKGMGLVKTALSPGEWMNFAKDRISEWQAGRNMESLARIITDPRAGDTFRKIATAKAKQEVQLRAARLIAQQAGLGERAGQ